MDSLNQDCLRRVLESVSARAIQSLSCVSTLFYKTLQDEELYKGMYFAVLPKCAHTSWKDHHLRAVSGKAVKCYFRGKGIGVCTSRRDSGITSVLPYIRNIPSVKSIILLQRDIPIYVILLQDWQIIYEHKGFRRYSKIASADALVFLEEDFVGKRGRKYYRLSAFQAMPEGTSWHVHTDYGLGCYDF